MDDFSISCCRFYMIYEFDSYLCFFNFLDEFYLDDFYLFLSRFVWGSFLSDSLPIDLLCLFLSIFYCSFLSNFSSNSSWGLILGKNYWFNFYNTDSMLLSTSLSIASSIRIVDLIYFKTTRRLNYCIKLCFYASIRIRFVIDLRFFGDWG